MLAAQQNMAPGDIRLIRIWLSILALLIVVMIIVGGATRLTDSGLSITEWAPIKGFLPPFTAEHWASEFAAYQTTDEFKYQNSAMSLAEFKFIYWWEWGHRFLGRLIGLFILIPMVAFWAMGKFNGWLKVAVVSLFLLICFQGFLGWWMVKSGLVDRVDVSQIRLAVHLTTAFILLAGVVWVARSLASHSREGVPNIRWQAVGLWVLLLVQIFIGGLVAGLDAGMAYNTWPTMNGAIVPDNLWTMTPWWQNLTDNAATVQFFHRMTAYGLWIVAALHCWSVYHRAGPSTHFRRSLALFVLVSLQALMGIVTLLLQAPLSWSLAHQLGGVILLIFATSHWRALAIRPQVTFQTAAVTVNGPHVGNRSNIS